MTEGRAAPLTREQWLAECCKLAKVYEDNMTKALDEIEKKALALLNEVRASHGLTPYENLYATPAASEALRRAIEQHEAFRQEVSDAVEEYTDRNIHAPITYLGRFLSAKPDPLVDALGELADRNLEARQAADTLRAAIEKRGGKIVWGEG